MGTWNHRVLRSVDVQGDVTLAIHEVHYDDDKPVMCTESPVKVLGEDVQELRQTLTWMLACLDKPVLEYSQFDKP